MARSVDKLAELLVNVTSHNSYRHLKEDLATQKQIKAVLASKRTAGA